MCIRGGDHESAQTLQRGISCHNLLEEVGVQFKIFVGLAIVQFHQESAILSMYDLHYFINGVAVFGVIFGLAESKDDL
jgi:hypothetical protein